MYTSQFEEIWLSVTSKLFRFSGSEAADFRLGEAFHQRRGKGMSDCKMPGDVGELIFVDPSTLLPYHLMVLYAFFLNHFSKADLGGLLSAVTRW